jgi:hypothetical protein
LFAPDGRHAGHVGHSRTTPPGRLVDRDRIAAARVMAHAIDRMTTIRTASRLVRDAVAGIVLTRGGSALLLGGRPAAGLLAAGSPGLAEAAERLDEATPMRLFSIPPWATGPPPHWCGSASWTAAARTPTTCGASSCSHRPRICGGCPTANCRFLGFVVAGRPDEHIATALESRRTVQ